MTDKIRLELHRYNAKLTAYQHKHVKHVLPITLHDGGRLMACFAATAPGHFVCNIFDSVTAKHSKVKCETICQASEALPRLG